MLIILVKIGLAKYFNLGMFCLTDILFKNLDPYAKVQLSNRLIIFIIPDAGY